MTKSKRVLLGVTGSIAAYKAGDIIRRLREQNCDVTVVMTESAKKFISPVTLGGLAQKPVVSSMFDLNGDGTMPHIDWAQNTDVVLVAPATANIIGQHANGLMDDLLSCILISTRAPIIMAPAMNTEMYTHKAVQKNIATLKEWGINFVEPSEGLLACGTTGVGHLADVDQIVSTVVSGKW